MQRGASVCRVNVPLPLAEIDARVLSMFEGQLLDHAVIQAAIDETVRRLHTGTSPVSERAKMQKRLAAIKVETDNIVQAIAKSGGTLDVLVDKLKGLEREREQIEGAVQRLAIIENSHTLTTKEIRQRLEGLLGEWRGHLRANMSQGRQMIRRLLDGRLQITPNADLTEFTISGVGVIEPLLIRSLPFLKRV